MSNAVQNLTTAGAVPSPVFDHYLDLLKKTLTAAIYPESSWQIVSGFRSGDRSIFSWLRLWIMQKLRAKGLIVVRLRRFDPYVRAHGMDWPCFGYSMIGLARMDNIQYCVETVLKENVPGDLIETGVWRGGSAMFMKAILFRNNNTDRRVWLADSFAGLPQPKTAVDKEQVGYDLSGFGYFAVSEEEVRENFLRFGLLDENVCFLKGWFADTLQTEAIRKIAVLRLDGDMYESTRDALRPLYPKMSPGGFVIVDDYFSWPGCKQAVDEYRSEHNITNPLVTIDNSAVWWRV